MPNEGKNYEYDVCSFYWLVRGLVKHRTFPERGEKHECQTWKKATAYYDDRTPAIEKKIENKWIWWLFFWTSYQSVVA